MYTGIIKLNRDTEVIEIPAGTRSILPAGSPVSIMQSLGGSYTISGGQYGALPSPGLVDTLKNNTPIDLVGYGIQGFARGGGQPQQVGGFTRFGTGTTLIAGNDRISGEFAKLHNGSCFGDSGGPDLLGGTNVVLAENSFLNNNVCAGNTYSYRVDTPQALNWITSTASAHGGSF